MSSGGPRLLKFLRILWHAKAFLSLSTISKHWIIVKILYFLSTPQISCSFWHLEYWCLRQKSRRLQNSKPTFEFSRSKIKTIFLYFFSNLFWFLSGKIQISVLNFEDVLITASNISNRGELHLKLSRYYTVVWILDFKSAENFSRIIWFQSFHCTFIFLSKASKSLIPVSIWLIWLHELWNFH